MILNFSTEDIQKISLLKNCKFSNYHLALSKAVRRSMVFEYFCQNYTGGVIFTRDIRLMNSFLNFKPSKSQIWGQV